MVITVIFSDYSKTSERRKYHTLIEYAVRIIFLLLTGRSFI